MYAGAEQALLIVLALRDCAGGSRQYYCIYMRNKHVGITEKVGCTGGSRLV